MKRRPERFKLPGADYEIRVVGSRPTPLKDFYHALLRSPWWVSFGVIAAAFVVINALFAAAFVAVGGVSNAHEGSFADAFFFSVQTLATIGYGYMYPSTPAANGLVVCESLIGLILTAVATGLVFAKFSHPTARVVFTSRAVISPMNGVPTLMIRVGNQRGNMIVDAQIRATLSRTERVAEGGTFYRNIDLQLVRDRLLSLSRSWTLLHEIREGSPLYGSTPESVERDELEISVLVIGLDDTTLQTVHARHTYFTKQIVWGARLADVLTEDGDGSLLLDLAKFHDIEPTRPTADFPYPRGGDT